MNTRRKLIIAFGAGALTTPVFSFAQQAKKVPKIGFLCAMNGPSPHTEAFLQGLRELGYVEGKNIHIEYRFTKGRVDPFPEFAAELVGMKLDVIVAASPPSIRPTMDATRKIPIVMAQSDDPVRSGFIASLARPLGNVTGLSSIAPELSSKQLELLKEALPKMTRVAVLWYPTNPAAVHQLKETEATARSLRVKLLSVEMRGPKDLDQAFGKIRKERAEALVVNQDLFFFDYQSQLVDFATKSRLPSMYAWNAFAEAGGLMAYGASDWEMFRRAAYFVDRILKGAKPADLPVEQPTRFELVINMKTAKALGITIPNSILLRADKVIE